MERAVLLEHPGAPQPALAGDSQRSLALSARRDPPDRADLVCRLPLPARAVAQGGAFYHGHRCVGIPASATPCHARCQRRLLLVYRRGHLPTRERVESLPIGQLGCPVTEFVAAFPSVVPNAKRLGHRHRRKQRSTHGLPRAGACRLHALEMAGRSTHGSPCGDHSGVGRGLRYRRGGGTGQCHPRGLVPAAA